MAPHTRRRHSSFYHVVLCEVLLFLNHSVSSLIFSLGLIERLYRFTVYAEVMRRFSLAKRILITKFSAFSNKTVTDLPNDLLCLLLTSL
jgi:hypothetical protein